MPEGDPIRHEKPVGQVDLADVRSAAEVIGPYIHRTPVLRSATLEARCGAEVYFKCENLQRAGAFKFRGACHVVMTLSDEAAARGVVTHSSGNHAQALALAARLRGIAATIVMPRGAPEVKRRAVEGYGATVVTCEPTLADRERCAEQIVQATGGCLVHPYNDCRIIAGQGTAALELWEQAGPLDAILAPVGGGGLLAGTAVAIAGLAPQTAVLGVEPAAADDACRSLEAGRIVPAGDPTTVADGLRTSLGTLTFPLLQRYVQQIVTVAEEEIIEAMHFVWERMKLVIEPSAAVPVAALLAGKVDLSGRRVGVILSGGNVDLSRLPWQ
jgi:threonine dehydratase